MRGEARGGHVRRWLLLAIFVGGLIALRFPAAGAAEAPTVEPVEGATGFAWMPSSVTLAAGATMNIRNPTKTVPHGVAWTAGPGKPSCTGVPVDGSGTDWSGSCTFAQAGTYSFVCTVHPEMKGTVTVSSGETTPAPAPPPGQPPGPPSAENPLQALRVASVQRGTTVRGALVLSPAAAGGKLVLDLRSGRGALGITGTGTTRVARPVRSRTAAGRQPFALPLRAPARLALRRRGHLSMTLKIVIAPPSGAAVTMTRKVTLHV